MLFGLYNNSVQDLCPREKHSSMSSFSGMCCVRMEVVGIDLFVLGAIVWFSCLKEVAMAKR